MTDREKWIDRLKKLKAKAESAAAIGNQAEAEAFAAKFQALLIEHKVSMSEVELTEQNVDDPLGYHEYHPDRAGFDPFDSRAKKRRVLWIEQLAMAVADAHFTKMILSERLDGVVTYMFVGRQSDVELAVWMFTVLGRNGIKNAKKEYDRAKRERRDTTDWYKTFLRAYQIAITKRYAIEREKLERQLSGTGTSLVPLDRARQEAEDFADKAFKTHGLKAIGGGGSNLEAHERGTQHGRDANLAARAVGGSTEENAQKKIAAGPKALPAPKKGGAA